MLDSALNDIRVLYEKDTSRTSWRRCIGKEHVLLWSKESERSIKETFDHLALALSYAYIDRTLDYIFCETCAEDLFCVLTDFDVDKGYNVEEPRLFWKFYLIFECGDIVGAERADEVARAEIIDLLSEYQAKI